MRPSRFLKWFQLPKRYYGLAICLGFFLLYLATAPRTNVSYADSDLFLAIGYGGGVAHPPGYALNTLLLYLFTHLPLPISIAFKGHLLSIILHSATLFFVFLTVWELVAILQQKAKQFLFSPQLDRLLISALATSSLGASFHFWTYSIVTEKYALNNFLAAVLIYLSFLILTSARAAQKTLNWAVLAFVFGLGLMHHQTIVLVSPLFLLLARQHVKLLKDKLSPAIVSFLIAIGVSLAILMLMNSRSVPVSWRFEPTLNGLWRELTRRDLAGYMVTTGEARGMYLLDFSLTEAVNQLPAVISLWVGHFTLPVLLIFLLGSIQLTKLNQKQKWFLALLLVFLTLFIPIYVDFPPDLSIQSIRSRMHLLAQLPIPLFVALGLHQLFLLIKKSPRLSTTPWLVIVLVISPFLYQLTSTYSDVNLKQFNFVNRYYQSILTKTPQNSLLVCTSDTACFAFLYLQTVEQIRPDVIILPQPEVTVSEHLASIQNLHYLNYPYNPEKTIDFISSSLHQHRPVSVVELKKVYYDRLGLEYGVLHYLPHGYFGQIQLVGSEAANPDYSFSSELAQQDFAKHDLMRQQLKAGLMQTHLFNALVKSKQGRDTGQIVQTELKPAETLASSLPETYQKAITDMKSLVLSASGFTPLPNHPTSSFTSQSLAIAADASLEQNNPAAAAKAYRFSLLLDPLNLPARQKLAKLYQQLGEVERFQAELESINLLQKHPSPPDTVEQEANR